MQFRHSLLNIYMLRGTAVDTGYDKAVLSEQTL